MIDREKVIKGLETCYRHGYECPECPYYDSEDEEGCHAEELLADALELIKKQRWHVFSRDEDGALDVECIPNNGEEFLWYRKYSDDMSVAPWDDDMYSEYGSNGDGEDFEDGDAWMELPEPPKEKKENTTDDRI